MILEGQELHGLTYGDVSGVPGYYAGESRWDVSVEPIEHRLTRVNIPFVVANMSRISDCVEMTETVARRGGVAVISQTTSIEEAERIIAHNKNASLEYESVGTVTTSATLREATRVMHRRAHDAVIVVDEKEPDKPIGIITKSDMEGKDDGLSVVRHASFDLQAMDAGLTESEMLGWFREHNHRVAPVVTREGKLAGVMTKLSVARSHIYAPAVDNDNRLLTAAAVGVNGDVAGRVEQLVAAGVDIIVIDTAHGHQKKMKLALRAARSVVPRPFPVVAGNVVTRKAVYDLTNWGADVIKVGIGPGHMCTTRVMTSFGVPQLKAVKDCAREADKLNVFTWADGGIRDPRDAIIALAAGASNVMIGSLLAGTYESAGEVEVDPQSGLLYVRNHGMASRVAIEARNGGQEEDYIKQFKREYFEEGIPDGIVFLNPDMPGVQDLIDYFMSGLRSAETYAGAKNLKRFRRVARYVIQNEAGHSEGKAKKVLAVS
ncbi:MAG TPA: IMP dehydrogenase [Candidatus Saccharimonadales bacterium]|nr:IMP dehydrogenase [Candidatus Saccharimonadales bacterium]